MSRHHLICCKLFTILQPSHLQLHAVGLPCPLSTLLRLQNKGEAALIKALQELLVKHGLSPNSDAAALVRVKAKLELSRDLEGIDMSNIINEDGGRPTRRAAARVDYK
jgi:hypothetical protein